LVDQRDLFSGNWIFSPERSKLSSATPKIWIQEIDSTIDELRVREKITTAAGSEMTVTIQARFDGKEYPVSGSAVADQIAYTRLDRCNICGTARKSGKLSLRETLTAAPDGHLLTVRYSIYDAAREVANGVAVFEKA
jgi:hypothetical protein